MSALPAPLPPGAVYGDPYIRVRVLGQGSFGRVLLVRDSREEGAGGPAAHYVMKEIDLHQFGAKGRVEALKEVAFLNQLSHPYIIRYKEFFERTVPLNGGPGAPQQPGQLVPLGKDGRPVEEPAAGRKMLYIVMEYADGGDLDARIKRQKKLHASGGPLFSEAQILDWFVQIVLALKHIHDRRILHRDVKAENIFLSSVGHHGEPQQPRAAPTVRLGDFGISKHLSSTLAQAMTRIGTPYYLSPEICMNKPYNTRSDIWSLGCVLYELCTLRHPFDAQSMEALLKKIVKTAPAPLNARVYSPDLRALVDLLLSKDPRKRPSVNDLCRMPLLSPLIAKHLPRDTMEAEFSHTVLHDYKALPPPEPSLVIAQQQHMPQSQQQQQQPSQRKKVKAPSAMLAPVMPPPSHHQQQQQQHQHQLGPNPYQQPQQPQYNLPPATRNAYQPHPGIKAVPVRKPQHQYQQQQQQQQQHNGHLPSPYGRAGGGGMDIGSDEDDGGPAPLVPPARQARKKRGGGAAAALPPAIGAGGGAAAAAERERERYELARLESVERQLAEERAAAASYSSSISPSAAAAAAAHSRHASQVHSQRYMHQQQQHQRHPSGLPSPSSHNNGGGGGGMIVDEDELRRFREYEATVVARRREHEAALERERAKERELQKQLALMKARAPASFPSSRVGAHSPYANGGNGSGAPPQGGMSEGSHHRRAAERRRPGGDNNSAREGVVGSGPLPLVLPTSGSQQQHHHHHAAAAAAYAAAHQRRDYGYALPAVDAPQQQHYHGQGHGHHHSHSSSDARSRALQLTRAEAEAAELAAIRESVAEEKLARRARRRAEEAATRSHILGGDPPPPNDEEQLGRSYAAGSQHHLCTVRAQQQQQQPSQAPYAQHLSPKHANGGGGGHARYGSQHAPAAAATNNYGSSITYADDFESDEHKYAPPPPPPMPVAAPYYPSHAHAHSHAHVHAPSSSSFEDDSYEEDFETAPTPVVQHPRHAAQQQQQYGNGVAAPRQARVNPSAAAATKAAKKQSSSNSTKARRY